MATHSGILAMDQEPGRLQSTESQTVGHNWIDFAHRTYNTLYTKKHPSLYHGEFFRVLKTFSYFTFYFHWLLDAIVRVDSFPLYRDNQTSGNSVNLHHSIPEAEQTADSEHFDLCSVDLLRKQSSKPLPTRLALGGCTMPSPTPAAPLCSHHIPCSTLWGGGWVGVGGPCLHTPVSDPSTSPKASLKQHMFYHPTGVQTSSEILGCANSADRGHVSPSQDRRRLWQKMQRLGSDWARMWAQCYFPPQRILRRLRGIQLWAVLKQDARKYDLLLCVSAS